MSEFNKTELHAGTQILFGSFGRPVVSVGHRCRRAEYRFMVVCTNKMKPDIGSTPASDRIIWLRRGGALSVYGRAQEP
jgi:hypothetical protein